MKANKVKVVSKGYTIRVVSCENDGDHYATNSMIVQTKEEAKAWYELMMFCKPFGNDIGFKKLYKNIEEIIEFMKTHRQLFRLKDIDFEIPKDILEAGLQFIYEEDPSNFKHLMYKFNDTASELLGGSDFYSMRVMKSCIVTYSPKDIYVEEVKF